MSADNYYTVKQDENGKYVAVMGFMSNLEDGHLAEIRESHKRFDTWAEAAQYAVSDYAEYGLIEETSN